MERSPLELHNLTDELKRLVGWGASPKRLPLLPVLLRLAKAEEASFTAQGYIVRDYLKESIGCVEAPITFGGREVQPATLRRIYLVLLGIEGSGWSAPNRRGRAIQLLGVYYSIETWRKMPGPEWELLYHLAELMVSRE